MRNRHSQMLCFRIVALIAVLMVVVATALNGVQAAETIRVATYNTSLFRDDGTLIADLKSGDNEQAKKIAEVIQRVRPDVMLVNEFDYDEAGEAAKLFQEKYLAVGQNGCEPIKFADYYIGPVNTGRPSGIDLDNNGRTDDPTDAFGFGRHEGQYGMLVLSRFPIDKEFVRTFQTFLWRRHAGCTAARRSRHRQVVLQRRREADPAALVEEFLGRAGENLRAKIRTCRWTLHLFVSHPTPPVFDGREDRNGRRNHDEIRLVADYISPDRAEYLVDDAAGRGGLDAKEKFVILGDFNCDPVDGAGIRGAMDQLLKHPRVNSDFTPASKGGPLNRERSSPIRTPTTAAIPTHVTSNFTHEGHGNLRIDYALPSRNLKIADSGVFWPTPDEPGADAIEVTDHRLVWIDVETE